MRPRSPDAVQPDPLFFKPKRSFATGITATPVERIAHLLEEVETADRAGVDTLAMSEALGGIDRVTLQMANERLAHADMLRAVELLGTAVKPRVGGAVAASA